MFKIFSRYPEVTILFSEKSDGDMRMLSGSLKSRADFLASHGVKVEQVISALLAHGNKVAAVSSADSGQAMSEVDSLITAAPGIYLSVSVADCLPIFFYDPKKGAVGLAHAGWRGLASGIIAATINQLTSEYKVNPGDLLVGIGPGIGSCHYEIQNDLATEFSKYPEAVVERDGKKFLDLKLIAKTQLSAAGVDLENIEISSDCTADSPEKYFSFRRDRPEVPQAMLALIGLKN